MFANESLVSISIPNELQQALEEYRQKNGIESTSDAVIEVLQKFFEVKTVTPAYASVKQVEALENWVENLAEQITAINQSIKYLSLARTMTSPAVSSDLTSLEEDEIEDEPDEILFDFLPEADK